MKAQHLEELLKTLKEDIEQKKNTNTLNMKEMSQSIARLTDVSTLREEIFANLPLIRKNKFRKFYQNSSIREINQYLSFVKFNHVKV